MQSSRVLLDGHLKIAKLSRIEAVIFWPVFLKGIFSTNVTYIIPRARVPETSSSQRVRYEYSRKISALPSRNIARYIRQKSPGSIIREREGATQSSKTSSFSAIDPRLFLNARCVCRNISHFFRSLFPLCFSRDTSRRKRESEHIHKLDSLPYAHTPLFSDCTPHTFCISAVRRNFAIRFLCIRGKSTLNVLEAHQTLFFVDGFVVCINFFIISGLEFIIRCRKQEV